MDYVFAQVPLKGLSPTPNLTTFADVVNIIVKNAFMLAGLLTFIILVFGGFSVIMGAGAGDTKQMEKGKSAITGAVVGLLVIVISYWIIQILEKITGQPILTTGL
jgi:hypothetical protein